MTSKGRDRNLRCWCGSGKKYKNCHLRREDERRVTVGEMRQVLQRTRIKTCLSPFKDGCTQPIRAHSVQRARLKDIATDGHVLQLELDMAHSGGHAAFRARRIGINEASCFEGFCGKHDDKIFAPIEKSIPSLSDPANIFLCAYRAICHELHAKLSVERLRTPFSHLDRGLGARAQREVQQLVSEHFAGVERGVADLRNTKSSFDEMLVEADYSRLSYALALFDGPIPIVATSATSTEYDFAGNLLQEPYAERQFLDVVTFSSFNVAGYGAMLFAWDVSHETCQQLTDSLRKSVKEPRVGAALTRFAFEHCENSYFSPAWWASLPEATKQWATRHARSTIDLERTPSCLQEDDVDVGDIPHMVAFELRGGGRPRENTDAPPSRRR